MMERLTQYVEKLIDLAPSAAAIVVVIVLLWMINRLLQRRLSELSEQGFKRPLITLVISLAGVLAVILLLPVSESSRGQLLSLLGILLSAAIVFLKLVNREYPAFAFILFFSSATNEGFLILTASLIFIYGFFIGALV